MTPLQLAQYYKTHATLVPQLRKPPAQQDSQQDANEVDRQFPPFTGKSFAIYVPGISYREFPDFTLLCKDINLAIKNPRYPRNLIISNTINQDLGTCS